MTARTTKPKIIRPTMVPTLKTPGNKGTEVIMVKTNFGPDPGPPADPLVIAENQGANWKSGNQFIVGRTVTAMSAAFTGGVEPIDYRCRFQNKVDDAWVSEPWITTTNAKSPITYKITENNAIRFQSQAKDASGPVNSTTAEKGTTLPNIGPVTAYIDETIYDTALGEPIMAMNGDTYALRASISGNASPTYNFIVRQGSATITGNGNTRSVTIDTAAPGMVQIQCDIIDIYATDNPKSFRYFFTITE